ncbi:acyl-CoA dehydratase activase [Chloroflexota bacterium]
MSYSLGLDIGSTTAKILLVNDSCQTVYLDTEKVTSAPMAVVISLISRLSEKFSIEDIASAGVSGSGKDVIPKELNWTEYSSPLAIAAGILQYHPNAKTIIQIGGQSSLVIELEDGLKKPWKVESNPLCAAGTGRFLEQQAYRVGISLDDFARLAMEYEDSPPRIAARCSVFAKSDLIHLQQKGVPMGAMLCALCGSIARMVVSLKKGIFEEPIYFVGGVAANKAVARSLNETLSARNGHEVEVQIPQNHLYIEALGSALLSRESGKRSEVTLLPKLGATQQYFEMPKLGEVVQHDGWSAPKVEGPFNGYLGVDVGSTSTKAVILDESGTKVLAKNYLMTSGNPVEAVKEVFSNLLRDVGDNAKIAGVGVTGSGRYLVGSFVGADLVKNEITAQTRAAADVDPDADIIEIGGQDSKLVIKRNGVVVDYQMNKACAAGTGSFIDELAEMLGVSVKSGEFADLAFKAPHTIDLGTRCAAFMGQAVASAQQEAVPLEVITASLANSIARNYLSKVVGTRKLGEKVILTGAVFYNSAVVSAFQQALEGKTLIVPEHKEISGAIGAALLAREEMKGSSSKFKGFQKIVDNEYTVSTFTCKVCENNCAISRMETLNEKPTFYGSRCDLFDSTIGREKVETLFDQREKLLFREYTEREAIGPSVGIPRALMVYDYAPLLIAFLNEIGANVVLSSKTTKKIMEQSVELSYSDSCFPVKLLHGHAASLSDVDYILYPCAIRMGLKDGEENQKYSCPLVQASPYIIKEVLGLQKRLLIPIIDFSTGDKNVIKSLADVGVEMGFTKREAKRAAAKGIEAQRRFEQDLMQYGQEALQQIREKGELGVVLLSRAYVFQDSGANMGIAEKLAQLGVVPIPIDFLPLNSVNVKEYTDRPYWISESKHIAGADITARDPSLYGLALTTFGCGPNSFMLNIVEDIMGDKPLGELEIDEHAAEAGIVTRLEAFVDTIRGFAHSGKLEQMKDEGRDISRRTHANLNRKKMLLLPSMCNGAEMLAAAMRAYGVRAMVLPEADEQSLIYSNKVTSGKECLPFRVTLGGFMKLFYESAQLGIDLNDVEGFMPSAFGPCRFGKYAVEEMKILREIGFDFPIRTTVSNNGYHDLGLGQGFERLAWKGIVASDYLERMLWRSRPYEKAPGSADNLFKECLATIAQRIGSRVAFDDVLREAALKFKSLIDYDKPRRPLVGINGEIFLRSNRFSNCDLARVCENAGLEVVISSIGEWIKYITHRNIEDGVSDRRLKKVVTGHIRQLILTHDEHRIASNFEELVANGELSAKEVLALSSKYLSPKCGSEAVLSIGTAIEWMESPEFAGVISVMPHGCMPGGIVAAMSDKLSEKYGKPWINVTYDGIMESTNLTRINNFAEVLIFCSKEEAAASHR